MSAGIEIRLLFFGPLADLAGRGPHAISLPDGATVGDAVAHAVHRWPALAPWEPSLLAAIDLTWARRDEPVPSGAELALMPPVQGG